MSCIITGKKRVKVLVLFGESQWIFFYIWLCGEEWLVCHYAEIFSLFVIVEPGIGIRKV